MPVRLQADWCLCKVLLEKKGGSRAFETSGIAVCLPPAAAAGPDWLAGSAAPRRRCTLPWPIVTESAPHSSSLPRPQVGPHSRLWAGQCATWHSRLQQGAGQAEAHAKQQSRGSRIGARDEALMQSVGIRQQHRQPHLQYCAFLQRAQRRRPTACCPQPSQSVACARSLSRGLRAASCSLKIALCEALLASSAALVAAAGLLPLARCCSSRSCPCAPGSRGLASAIRPSSCRTHSSGSRRVQRRSAASAVCSNAATAAARALCPTSSGYPAAIMKAAAAPQMAQ